MRTYNRALDFTVLALNELKKGKPQLAAKLFAKAAAEPDCDRAIQILEASNKQAFEVAAKAAKVKASAPKRRLTAGDEDLDTDPLDELDDDAEVEAEFGDDEVEDDGEEIEDPGMAMAAVLATMTNKPTRKSR